jgi:ubiquitin related modifier 1
MLFSDEKKHKLTVPSKDDHEKPATIKFLVNYLCENLMKDPRREMFVLDDSV